ncbi:glycine receptor subunit alpha-2 isoform X1 [Metopolophium dirhodum]|uniref:glycine receptor subunit alpha-2 isoform X1 n=1 Tax=Metopolophium dirhodum TaxID=44670 RepID=UPI00298FA193|nr:glycine receptor subunit alpha-2 isoform X1 [Metopolophium dirhodum]
MASLMTNLFFLYGIYVLLIIGQTALSSQKYRHCYARHHKRSANPTFRYRPHVSECASPSSTVASSNDDGCEESRRQSTEQRPVQRRLPASQIPPTTTPPLTLPSSTPPLTLPSSTTPLTLPSSTPPLTLPSSTPPPPPTSPPPQPPARTNSWPPGHGLHKHLLLVTGQVYQEFISECSVAEQARDLHELSSKLERRPGLFGVGDFVLVQVGTGWRLNVQLLDVLVDRLGNVSMYADKKYYSKTMTKHCRNIGDRCTLLANLVPVIEQLELRQEFLIGGGGGGGMYDPDWIPVPAVPPLPRNFTGDTEKQIEYLTWRLCVRDRRQNFYYKLDQDSLRSPLSDQSDIAESDNVVFETSLSLTDILPINPKNYDKNRAPKVQGQPTIVYFHVTVLSLDSINEESMTYVADIFLAQSWRDQRLRLPENMSEDYRILDVEWLHDIWRPDCFFKNAKKVTFHEMSIPNHYLWLYHDKTLLYMSKLTLVLSCAMKFESYPHDTQICSMMIESLSHTTHDLVFIWNMTDPLVVNPDIELPQLDISNNITTDCTIEYSTGNFTCLAVMFNLRRRLGYHLFHTYIPSALIVVMSWISFWIKPEAIPARVTLGVTSLLTLATQNTQSQQSLPPVSYVKAIDIWMSSCSIFVFLSLMEFAVVNNYMGPVATKVMKGYSEEDIRGGDDFKELDPKNRSPIRSVATVAAAPQYPTFCNGRAIALYIDKFSRFFFPFSFFILNVAYWTSFL